MMVKLHTNMQWFVVKTLFRILRRVINSSSFAVKRRDGPDFSLFNFSDTLVLVFSLESQYFNPYLAGPRKVNKASNYSGKSSVKNFVFFLSFRTTPGSIVFLRSGVDCLFILNHNLISQNYSFNF